MLPRLFQLSLPSSDMNEGDRAAAAAATQAAKASLFLRMQVDQTATASNLPANRLPNEEMDVTFGPSPTAFTTSSAESAGEEEWVKVQSASEKRAEREKRKADQAEINTPNSPLVHQGETSSQPRTLSGHKPTSEHYLPKSHPQRHPGWRTPRPNKRQSGSHRKILGTPGQQRSDQES